VDSMA